MHVTAKVSGTLPGFVACCPHTILLCHLEPLADNSA